MLLFLLPFSLFPVPSPTLPLTNPPRPALPLQDSGVLSPLSPDDLEHMGAFEPDPEHGQRHNESGIGSGADSVGGGIMIRPGVGAEADGATAGIRFLLGRHDKKKVRAHQCLSGHCPAYIYVPGWLFPLLIFLLPAQVSVPVQTEPLPREFLMLEAEERARKEEEERRRLEEERLAREAEERARREEEELEASIMGDSVMRYLKMVRRNSKSADQKKADRFR